jgi:uncharacterized protein YegL
MPQRFSRSRSFRGLVRTTGLLLSLVVAGCGSSDEDPGPSGPTGGETGSGGSGGSSTGSGGSGGSTTGGGTAGKSGKDASTGTGGSSAGDAGGSRDGGDSAYAFPLTLTPLTTASTATSNISLYFSVTDSKGVGVVGLPTTVKVPADPADPFGWVYREDGQDLDPKESGFSVTPLQGNTLDMPTILVLDLSGSIAGGGAGGGSLLDKLKNTANAIIDKMLPEQRMAILTFAGSATLRVPLTNDKQALKASVTALTMGDGQSTNLYGAMIQAFGMWQDGFATAGGAKLTAGLAIVLTDGKDNAGVKTLSDVIATRKNKRVVAVGIGDPTNPAALDVGAMMQLSTTGTFVQVTSFDTLGDQVGLITNAMSTLGRSIYTANYCTPKLSGSHELLFTLQGNGSKVSTTCTPATFPSNHPSLCAQLDPSYTQACGYTKGPTTYTCCTATAPYTCPNDTSCYKTAEAAAAKCGAASSGGTCLMCGGSGAGSSQDTQLVPGAAIRVRFDATRYKDGQCPLFWGPACKALQTCCAQVPADGGTACNDGLLAAAGNEATCQMLSAQYCGGDAGGSADAGSSDVRSDGADAGIDRAGPFPPPPPPPPPF